MRSVLDREHFGLIPASMMTTVILVDINDDVDQLRLTSEQARDNRRLIVETASRMFRLHGIGNISVADIMKESGFMHGGFHNHFKSKEDLATKAVVISFENAANDLSEKLTFGRNPQKALASVLVGYLSSSHRDTSSGGCPASAFPVDATRNGKDIQTAFANGIEKYLDIFAGQMGGNKHEARQEAIGLLSRLVGALMLSRAVKKSNEKFSEELLRSAHKHFCKK
jgi:TetR/AcrR family transcriptional regulator, transcriptional repressor for nem operon